MRKLFAIALLALFGLPFASALFALAPKSEANLPVCCRRNGTHHCMMGNAEGARLAAERPGFTAPLEKCRFALSYVVPAQRRDFVGASASNAAFDGYASGVVVLPPTPAAWRFDREHTHPKRGPPTA